MRFTFFLALGAAGCSLNAEGTGTIPDDPSDSANIAADSIVNPGDTSSPTPDAVTEDTEALDVPTPDADTSTLPDTTPTPDLGPPCSEAACGTLPAGARRVALIDRTFTCPTGFASTDVLQMKDADACSCSCTLSSPTCPGNGEIKTWYSSSAGCGTVGSTVSSAGTGVCTALGFSGSLSAYFKAAGPGPTGGGCAPALKVDGTLNTRPRRICEPTSAACAGDMCKTPFTECVEGVPCGGAFPNQITIGTGATTACPACTCVLAPGSCTGSATFHNTSSCGGGSVTLAVNNTCVAVGTAPSVSSLRYTPNPVVGAGCTPSYATDKGTQNVVGQRTLCCR